MNLAFSEFVEPTKTKHSTNKRSLRGTLWILGVITRNTHNMIECFVGFRLAGTIFAFGFWHVWLSFLGSDKFRGGIVE